MRYFFQQSLIFLIVSIASLNASDTIEYKQVGLYKLESSKHLINDITYKNKNLYTAAIEIPTGSREKWEVNHKSGHLEWEFKNDKPRKVKFLGYPGNYGFIPQTLSGDNDPLDIIVLSESSPRGSFLDVKIIGMIKLLDKSEDDYKVIGIMPDGAFKKIDSLKEMLLKKPHIISIIRLWFEGYKDPGKITFMGYEDKKKTIGYIEQSHKRWRSKQLK